MAEYQEKSQEATPKKRQKAREKGQIPRSREVNSMAAMAGIVLFFFFAGKQFFNHTLGITKRLLNLYYGIEPLTVFRSAMFEAVIIIIPLFAASVVLATGASVLQGGIVLKPLKWEFNRINPVEGIKRIFSKHGLVELIKSLSKFTIGGYLFYYFLKKEIFTLPFLMNKEISVVSVLSANLLMKAILYGFIFLFIVAVLSYLLERWRFEQSLKMSREEIKEELKESEGDPLIKSRIKSLQRERARKRMMQEVPKATVVITNPVHIAVALKYEDKKMSAPQIVAKGTGFVAEKIKEIAKKRGVPIVEDKPMARTLNKLELNDYIPEELYKAVAKILAYICQL